MLFFELLIARFNILIDKMLPTWIVVACSTYLNNVNFLVQFLLAIFVTTVFAYVALYFLAISFIHLEGKRMTGMIWKKVLGK